MGPIIPQQRDQLVIKQDDKTESSQNVEQNGLLRRSAIKPEIMGFAHKWCCEGHEEKNESESESKLQLFHKSYFLGKTKDW